MIFDINMTVLEFLRNVAAKFGIKPILFNRDGVTYGGTIVNNFSELEAVL